MAKDKTLNFDDDTPQFMRFAHEAMKSYFEIIIEDDNRIQAAAAAREAFDYIDKLEQRFSRFISNSEISALCSLPAKTPFMLSQDTFEILAAAKKYHQQTNGLFDITLGPLSKCWFDQNRKLRQPDPQELQQAKARIGMDNIILNETDYSAYLTKNNMVLDLGGIGKGYAIDKAVEILKEWDIKRALIVGGFSSIYAIGTPSDKDHWLISASDPLDKTKVLSYIKLKDNALSSSGIAAGRHIIDPRNSQPVTTEKLTAWVICENATRGDCLSTAIMLMNQQELQNLRQKNPELQIMQISIIETDNQKTSKLEKFGDSFIAP